MLECLLLKLQGEELQSLRSFLCPFPSILFLSLWPPPLGQLELFQPLGRQLQQVLPQLQALLAPRPLPAGRAAHAAVRWPPWPRPRQQWLQCQPQQPRRRPFQCHEDGGGDANSPCPFPNPWRMVFGCWNNCQFELKAAEVHLKENGQKKCKPWIQIVLGCLQSSNVAVALHANLDCTHAQTQTLKFVVHCTLCLKLFCARARQRVKRNSWLQNLDIDGFLRKPNSHLPLPKKLWLERQIFV